MNLLCDKPGTQKRVSIKELTEAFLNSEDMPEGGYIEVRKLIRKAIDKLRYDGRIDLQGNIIWKAYDEVRFTIIIRNN